MGSLLRISEAANLALHTMTHLAARPGERCTAHAMAALFDVSENHLSKVLQRLAKAGLVRSARGPGGGYALGLPAQSVTLLEVFEAVEGPMTWAECLLRKPVCDGTHCVLGTALREANALFREHFEKTRLSDFAPKKAGRRS